MCLQPLLLSLWQIPSTWVFSQVHLILFADRHTVRLAHNVSRSVPLSQAPIAFPLRSSSKWPHHYKRPGCVVLNRHNIVVLLDPSSTSVSRAESLLDIFLHYHFHRWNRSHHFQVCIRILGTFISIIPSRYQHMSSETRGRTGRSYTDPQRSPFLGKVMQKSKTILPMEKLPPWAYGLKVGTQKVCSLPMTTSMYETEDEMFKLGNLRSGRCWRQWRKPHSGQCHLVPHIGRTSLRFFENNHHSWTTARSHSYPFLTPISGSFTRYGHTRI